MSTSGKVKLNQLIPKWRGLNNWDQAFIFRNMRLISFHIFMAYKEFSKQIHVENSEELVAEPFFCNQNILVGNRIIFL